MFSLTHSLILASALFSSGVFALPPVNNWDVACTSGSCRYSSGGAGKPRTSFNINGPSGAISDISRAAGWSIEGCPTDWSEGAVHVTIKCTGTRAQMALCEQLFDGDGADDTIVRLPQNCGTGPFARLVSSTDITNRGRFVSGPKTLAVVLDYQFHKIQRNRGAVSFSISSDSASDAAASKPGLADFRRRSSELAARWDHTQMFDLDPIAINKDFNLYRNSISCPAPSGTGVGFSADISVDAGVNVNALVSLGYTIEGTIIPLAISKFQLLGNLNGSASADFTVTANAHGSFNTGSIPIYEASLPGVNIPGIFELGPKFGVYGEVDANVGIQAVVKAGVSYTFPKVEFKFPNNGSPGSGTALTKSNPFVLSVDPSASANGQVNAAITPKVSLGINVLSGLAEATVYLDLKASAVLDLTIEGHASVVIPLEPGVKPKPDTSGSASGRAALGAGVAVTVGAKGALKPIWEDSVEYDIFSQKWDIFDKSFGVSTPATRRSVPLGKRDFACPALGLSGLLQVLKL